MYQVQIPPIQPAQTGGGWKALGFLLNTKKKPASAALTPQQQQAFGQGGGPLSQMGAQNYLSNSFNSQIWDGYQGFQGMPSIYERLMKGY